MDKMRQAMTDFVSEFVWREAQEELFSTKSGWNVQAGLESMKKKRCGIAFAGDICRRQDTQALPGVPKKEKEC
jgi:hypothetical protein